MIFHQAFSGPSHHYNLSTWLQKTPLPLQRWDIYVTWFCLEFIHLRARFPKKMSSVSWKLSKQIPLQSLWCAKRSIRGFWSSGTSDSEWLGMKDTDSSSIQWMPLSLGHQFLWTCETFWENHTKVSPKNEKSGIENAKLRLTHVDLSTVTPFSCTAIWIANNTQQKPSKPHC